MENSSKRLIVALDFNNPDQARELVGSLSGLGVSFKVGFELFLSGGPDFVAELASCNPVFLDLKFHDIPNTVASAVKAAGELGIWMLNLHAAGGGSMMQAAREAAERCSAPPVLIAVTVLTSLNNEDMAATGCVKTVSEHVSILTRLAFENGMDGIVCSPREIKQVKETVSEPFLTVTPGVRPAGFSHDDQARLAEPSEVIEAGGDYLVVGRPITRSMDPVHSAKQILKEMGVV